MESAIRFVRSRAKQYKVDPERIALIGESAGGHLVSMVGARSKRESRVSAVVSFYGPHDLERRAVEQNQVSEPLRDFLGITELNPKSIKILHEASPIVHVVEGMPPYLLIHGTKDEQVPYDQSPSMCERMKAVGNTCEVFTVEGGGHGIGGWEKAPAFQKYKAKMIEWLLSLLS